MYFGAIQYLTHVCKAALIRADFPQPLTSSSQKSSDHVQAAKLTSSLEYHKRNDLQAAIQKLEQQIKDDKDRHAELKRVIIAVNCHDRCSVLRVYNQQHSAAPNLAGVFRFTAQ